MLIARWMESLWLDVRFGVRGLLRNPGITITALLALALGIGANTAVFSVARATLWRDLPYRDPERLVTVWQRLPGMGRDFTSPVDVFEAWRLRNHSFEALAALSSYPVNLNAPGEPALVPRAWVTPDFFAVAGVEMAVGRAFLASDVRPGKRVAVISHRVFEERYGGDPSRLRAGIVLDGTRYTVTGVAPAGFNLFGPFDVWLPDVLRPPLADPYFHILNVLGRLPEGASLERANQDLQGISLEIGKRVAVYSGLSVRLVPLLDLEGREVRRTLRILGLFAGCILLIACADVAGLLVARATGREHEIALRAALGATRGRLTRGILVEYLLLFLLAGLLGLPMAVLGARGLAALAPRGLPAGGAGLHGGALFFTLGISLAAGLLSGLLPALSVTGRSLTEYLTDSRRLAGSRAGRRTRNPLVAVQVALAVILFVSAGLLKESFDRLRTVDPGFQASGILTLDVQLPVEKYNDTASRTRLFQEMLAAVRRIPGAEAAALAYPRPFSMVPRVHFTLEGPLPKPENRVSVAVRNVTPGYFAALRIPVVRGRGFRGSEGSATPRVAVVNERMANLHWPGRSPIGQRFVFGYGLPEDPGSWITIVGVVRDARERKLEEPPPPTAYTLLTQENLETQELSVLVRAPGDPLELVEGARKAVRQADPGLAAGSLRRLEDVIGESIARNRFWALLGQLFAALALTLTVVGIYGVVSYSVARRTHEIGVRAALGARPGDILRRVILRGMAPVVSGLVLGLALARLLLGVLEGQLYQVHPGHPLAYVAAAAAILLAALVATYFPAFRATQVDPVAALREE